MARHTSAPTLRMPRRALAARAAVALVLSAPPHLLTCLPPLPLFPRATGRTPSTSGCWQRSIRYGMNTMISILASTTLASSAKPLPHLISILQDDLGYYDSGVHSEKASLFTHNISALAKEGIVLTNHYTHWHCSPTRRSFLSGRLPIHHGEQLSNDDSDDIDLRMTWISGKLASAGYEGHWFGKWHTGFRSVRCQSSRRVIHAASVSPASRSISSTASLSSPSPSP